MKTLENSVNQAIEDLRSMYYKGTYVKIELEGHLDRRSEAEECENCSGTGEYECPEEHEPYRDEDGDIIDGEYEDSCDRCHDGMIQCDDCHGSGVWGESPWNSEACDDFIFEHVSDEARDNTVFHDFCNDGSVDSEFMFTVPLTREGLGYAMEYIRAFKALAGEIGNGLDVKPAGMHITVLRSPNGEYPSQNMIEGVAFDNFKENMDKLMPALLLLASPDYRSRSISTFRRPAVGIGDHRNAVDIANHGNSDVLEWRVFETCYDRPEMLLDYICTIAKGLKYFNPEVEPVVFKRKIGTLEFIDDGSKYGLHKYYHTEKHLVALKAGLKYLKPDHRSVQDCLRIRNFTVTKDTIKRQKQRIAWRVEDEFDGWCKNQKLEMERWVIRRLDYEASMRADIGLGLTDAQRKAQTKRLEKMYRQAYPLDKQKFVKRRIQECLRSPHCNKVEITI